MEKNERFYNKIEKEMEKKWKKSSGAEVVKSGMYGTNRKTQKNEANTNRKTNKKQCKPRNQHTKQTKTEQTKSKSKTKHKAKKQR